MARGRATFIRSIKPEEWAESGLCGDRTRQPDPDLWFPASLGHGGKRPLVRMQARAAIAVCGICPVRVQCFRYSIRHRIKDGIWGGLTYWERRRYWA